MTETSESEESSFVLEIAGKPVTFVWKDEPSSTMLSISSKHVPADSLHPLMRTRNAISDLLEHQRALQQLHSLATPYPFPLDPFPLAPFISLDPILEAYYKTFDELKDTSVESTPSKTSEDNDKRRIIASASEDPPPIPLSNSNQDQESRTDFLSFLNDVAAASPDQKPDELDALGGEQGVGRTVSTPNDLLKAVESGFRAASVDALVAAGFLQSEIEAVIAPLRTLQRRRRDGRLAREESDAALRMARILGHAEMTLGSRERAFAWLRRPNRMFSDQAPMTLLATEAGGRRVDDLLLRADFGQMA